VNHRAKYTLYFTLYQ